MSAKKILIVDDEPSVVTYLAALLEDAGYETVGAADGEEGLERFKSEKPDLVTLDINMPKMSGMRLYREMREHEELSAVPVVVVTAVTGYGNDPDEFRRFLSSRKHLPAPEGFLAKPIDPNELLGLVGRLVPGEGART